MWEWTADWYQAAYPIGNPVVDPTGPASGWSRGPAGWFLECRRGGTAFGWRGPSSPSNRFNYIGFRVSFQFTEEYTADLNASVQMEMLWVEPGTFTMGSPTTEAGRQSDREDEHNVTLTQGFYLGKYEVTQAQYEAVMTGVTGDRNATPSNWHGNLSALWKKYHGMMPRFS